MGKFITREDGHYICEEDYKQSKEKCDHCGLPMLDRVLTAIDKKYHPACFRYLLQQTGRNAFLTSNNAELESFGLIINDLIVTHISHSRTECI